MGVQPVDLLADIGPDGDERGLLMQASRVSTCAAMRARIASALRAG